MYSRRKFLNYSSKAVAALGATSLVTNNILAEEALAFAKKKKLAPSDQVNIGLIGCKGLQVFNRLEVGFDQLECFFC